MPYGVDKKLGGDNKTNDSFMERCVNGITGKNKRTGKEYSKGEKIAICKTALKKRHESNSEYIDESVIDLYYLNTESLLVNRGVAKNYSQANELSNSVLEAKGWDIEEATQYLNDLVNHR